MENKTKLWMCGQIKGEWKAEETVWEFQGIFSAEKMAIAACHDENYFICPVILDQELPNESLPFPDGYYPLLVKE